MTGRRKKAASGQPRAISAIASPDETIFGKHLLGRFFEPAEFWRHWLMVVKAAFGLPLTEEELRVFREVSGRETAPTKRAKELWIISGRRSGKTATASGLAAHFGAFYDWRGSGALRPGEFATIMCLATDKSQATILLNYIRAYFREVSALKRLVVRETAEGFQLSTGAEIVVQTANFRGVRGKANALTLLDEIAFFRSEESASPDVEVYRALLPNHATLGGLIVGISSPHKKSGLLYDKWAANWGQDDSDVLVIRGASLLFNPSLDPTVVAAAYSSDPAAANAEWGAEWRSDLEGYIDSAAVKAAVVAGRFELPPQYGVRYTAFADPASGGKDNFALAIAHKEGETVVVDVCRERNAAHPSAVVEEYATLLKAYRCSTVFGDRVAKSWVQESFQKLGITYKHSDKSKSDLYIEFLPLLLNSRVELPDDRKLVTQICSLERTITRGTGREIVDAPRGASEDKANAVAGVCVFAQTRQPMKISEEHMRMAMTPPRPFRGIPVLPR